jgi:hypothetical protein
MRAECKPPSARYVQRVVVGIRAPVPAICTHARAADLLVERYDFGIGGLLFFSG